jgi:hypothetical protein
MENKYIKFAKSSGQKCWLYAGHKTQMKKIEQINEKCFSVTRIEKK